VNTDTSTTEIAIGSVSRNETRSRRGATPATVAPTSVAAMISSGPT
jgi:hypothetical protein